MQAIGGHRHNPELRALVVEASLALARLDADRLEELAACCQALNRDLFSGTGDRRAELERQAHGVSREMEIFGRVLEGTRANLEVMNRVRERRNGRREYGATGRTGWEPWPLAEDCNGNH